MNPSAYLPILTLLVLANAFWPAGASAASLRAWGEVSKTDPYVQETLVYTLKVASDVPLATVDPSPPPIAGLSMEKLEGPVTRYGRTGRPGETVVEYRYALTPLTPGRLEIPAMSMEVTFAPGQAPGPFSPWYQPPRTRGPTTASADPIQLTVRPAASEVQPWLPLKSLHLQAQWVHQEAPEIGKPLTLRVVLTASGGSGEQLPDLQSYLRSPDFKVYPERPKTERSITPDGVLQGRRITTYTLIPQREGMLTLSELRIPWWDVDAHQAEAATWPEQIIRVAGPGMAATASSSSSSPTPAVKEPGSVAQQHPVLLMVTGALLFGAGWWFGAGRPGMPRWLGRAGAWTMAGMRWLRGRLQQGTVVAARAVIPAQTLAQLNNAIARTLPPDWRARLSARVTGYIPRPVKIWRIMGRIDATHDPAVIARLVQHFGHNVLRLPLNTPLRRIGATIAASFESASAREAPRLLARLDHAVYGDEIFFEDEWKTQCRKTCWRVAFSRRRRDRDGKLQGLPELNPG
jgi:hypothetical protein